MGTYLIIGASGFIGSHIYNYCKRNHVEVVGTFCHHCEDSSMIKFDLRSDNLEKICDKYFKEKLPENLILCGANASIDSCKKDENASREVNVVSTLKILKQADKLGIKSVFLSSEAVFDGNKGLYTENDVPNPVTLYGKQKLEVERYISENIRNYLIFRVSRATGSCYGENDIFREFHNKISFQKEIVCLKNQSFCLTEVDDIVLCIINSLEKDMRGLFHISSGNYISRYELAKVFADKIFGGYDKIVEKEYYEMDFLDNRHVYGGLDGSKLEKILGIKYMSISDILNRYIETYKGCIQ